MKIYTKRGDKGLTSLYNGEEVYKDNVRVEAYGTIDELNSWIGILRSMKNILSKDVLDVITIQNKLFDIGALLAAGNKENEELPQLSDSDVTFLEETIDKLNEDLEPLDKFVLPGGHRAISTIHIMRTVCRRAERCVVKLHQQEPVNEIILQYLNRLSDLIFVLSRYLSKEGQVEEITWEPGK